MLDDKTDTDLAAKTNAALIDSTLGNLFATPAERQLAERLQAAIEELERMEQALRRYEATNG